MKFLGLRGGAQDIFRKIQNFAHLLPITQDNFSALGSFQFPKKVFFTPPYCTCMYAAVNAEQHIAEESPRACHSIAR